MRPVQQAEPIVAIVGRPNVGKSCLFNRIVGRRHAIVDQSKGVTRDRLYSLVKWSGKSFRLVDTGGLELTETSKIASRVRKQIDHAIKESEVLLWVVDAEAGILPIDEEIAKLLRQSGKQVLLVVNKVEGKKSKEQMPDFFRLGFGEPHAVSALHGLGIGELLDNLTGFLPYVLTPEDETDVIRVAIVGRPNVGKSSFLNQLLGEERVIVDESPGTTRDAIDTVFGYEGERYIMIDTAGIRRQSRVKEPVDAYSLIRSRQAIERCQASLVLTEAQEGILEGDLKILNMVLEAGKACVLVVNKWDLVKDITIAQYEDSIQKRAKFLKDIPVVFTSALKGKNILKAIQYIRQAINNAETHIPTGELNRILTQAQKGHPHPFIGKYQARFYYFTQIAKSPPTIVGFVNNPELVRPDYLKYLENCLRKVFDLRGTPLRFEIRKRETQKR